MKKHLFSLVLLVTALASCQKPKVQSTILIGNVVDEIHVGETVALVATVEPACSTCVIAWKSDDETIATVDNDGLVSALSVGEATIIATLYEDNSREKTLASDELVFSVLPKIVPALLTDISSYLGEDIIDILPMIDSSDYEYNELEDAAGPYILIEMYDQEADYVNTYRTLLVQKDFELIDQDYFYMYRYVLEEHLFLIVQIEFFEGDEFFEPSVDLYVWLSDGGVNLNHSDVNLTFETMTGILSTYLGDRSTFMVQNSVNNEDFSMIGYRVNTGNYGNTVLSDQKGIVLSSASSNGNIKEAYIEFAVDYIPSSIEFECGIWVSGGTSGMDTLTKVSLQQNVNGLWVDTFNLLPQLEGVIKPVHIDELTETSFRLQVEGTSLTNNGGRLIIDTLKINK